MSSQPTHEQQDNLVNLAADIADKALKIKNILVIYEDDNGLDIIDNGITIAQALYMMETVKHWMMSSRIEEKD